MSEFLSTIRMRTWAEIDLDDIEYNFKAVRSLIGSDAKLCCVVKANGYGHSAPSVSSLFERLGADMLAVSNVEEALQLRDSGISLPILILGYTPVECADILAKYNITQCVYSYDYGIKLAENAFKKGVKVKIHIKLDTGMGRIGFLCRSEENELDKALDICRRDSLIHEGIFTHFTSADEGEFGKQYTDEQFALFNKAIEFFKKNGVEFELRHCANSAATLKYPEYHLDMVRAGIILYGLSSCENDADELELLPVMSMRSVISHIKELKAGESVSYGRIFTAQHDMRVATVPVGYADGLFRSTASSDYTLQVRGKDAPIIGRICMDQLMLDVSNIACEVGDTVTVFGKEKGHTAKDLAFANQTIPYEVICSVGKRVPRAFVKNGKIIGWSDAIYDM